MLKIKLTSNKLKKLHHLVALVEGAVTISLNNLFCNEETALQFYTEKNKLARLFTILETNIPRYISQQQILALSEIVKIGHKFIPVLYKKKLIGQTYLNDFLALRQYCPR